MDDKDTEPIFPKHIQDRLNKGMGCWSHIEKGWLPLLEELDRKISEINPDYVLDQIKEKFGVLTVYVSHDFVNETQEQYFQIEKLIAETRQKSSEICDVCGNSGSLQKGSWWRTLCDKHTGEK